MKYRDHVMGFTVGIISCIPMLLLVGIWFFPFSIGIGLLLVRLWTIDDRDGDKWLKNWIFWNMILYLFCVLLMFIAVQHSTFMYSFPPELDSTITVHISLYFILGLVGYFLFKSSHFILIRSKLMIKGGV